MNIKFYREKYHKLEPKEVFLVDHNAEWDEEGELVSYCPIGQHGPCSPKYLKEKCIEITKEEYIKGSYGVYTPEEYLK